MNINILGILSAIPLLIFACNNQVSTPVPTSSPTASASTTTNSSPSSNPDTMDSTKPRVLVDVKNYSGCNGSIILCEDGTPCAVPSCLESSPPIKIDPPTQINESKYDEIKTKFSLFNVSKVRDNLGSLKPALPMAEGLKAQAVENEGLVFNGGKLGSANTLIIQNPDNTYQHINNLELLKKTFAPIESGAEAVSYLTAATSSEAKFTITYDQKLDYYLDSTNNGSSKTTQDSISPTTAILTADTYRVNMFYYQKFGCGPHPTYEVIYDLNKNGDFKEVSRKMIYKNPQQDGLCVD